MEMTIYLVMGIMIGIVLGGLIFKIRTNAFIQNEKETAQKKYSEIEIAFETNKATALTQLQTVNSRIAEQEKEIESLSVTIGLDGKELSVSNNDLATAIANNNAANNTIDEKNNEIMVLKEDVKNIKNESYQINQQLATKNANNEALNEKLETQKKEIEEMGKKFNTEFENIANKIFDTKSEKFTELNKTNLKAILEPLGENIDGFKKQVDEVYNNEAKERFSLGEKVKELAMLNQEISEEAKNLTRALKGESKTQGCWGEMILESILERSGLRKNEQYFMEMELKDNKGKALRSDSEGKKMRPDVVIKYPDNRNVIIDSKVSLNAFTRLTDATDIDVQKKELDSHILAVKNHIISLSTKGYDDYDKALDFVMMFIPSEPAYIAALQGDADLWNFAYDKRILIISPTNLITSLKIIVDLWKREYQNRNALEIASRGAKLYDKFVGFLVNLESVGQSVDRAQESYNNAYKQLYTGNDNLVLQTTKLKKLGLKTKKELPEEIVFLAEKEELPLLIGEQA